jgi:hypothetical protein
VLNFIHPDQCLDTEGENISLFEDHYPSYYMPYLKPTCPLLMTQGNPRETFRSLEFAKRKAGRNCN